MLEPASPRWHLEAIARRDSQTGVLAIQLTSAPLIHHLPGLGSPAFTADSRALIYWRRQAPDLPTQLWLADLDTQHLRALTDEPGVAGPALSPDGEHLYYLVAGRPCELRRVSLRDFSREVVLSTDLLAEPNPAATLRADGAAYVASGPLAAGSRGLVRFDIPTRQACVIWQSDEAIRPRPQYRPDQGDTLLIQLNHGAVLDDQGRCLSPTSGYGLSLLTLADDGSRSQTLSLGRSDVEILQGRHCWAGDSGLVAVTLLRRDRPDLAFTSDSLIWMDPASGDRELVGLGQHFAHPSVSADARWWACDVLGTGDIFLGSSLTGRYQAVTRGAASFGMPGHTHPHPCLSPNGELVAYNSDRTGVPQICVADTTELRKRLRTS